MLIIYVVYTVYIIHILNLSYYIIVWKSLPVYILYTCTKGIANISLMNTIIITQIVCVQYVLISLHRQYLV